MAPRAEHHPSHRPARRRELTTPGSAPLGGRAHRVLARRMPSTPPTLRTQARALPGLHRHRHQPHQPPPTHQVKRRLRRPTAGLRLRGLGQRNTDSDDELRQWHRPDEAYRPLHRVSKVIRKELHNTQAGGALVAPPATACRFPLISSVRYLQKRIQPMMTRGRRLQFNMCARSLLRVQFLFAGCDPGQLGGSPK